MAIYHCSLRVFSRSNGDSAVAAAAYRAGAVLHDERSGYTHRYQHRKGVVSSFILAPADAPENTFTRTLLWNAAERAETRKNSRVARELILALPHELPAPAREALTRDMAGWLVERYRVAVDGALHSPANGDNPLNHHAHLLFTTREMTKDGLGAKTRILDDKEKGPHEIELIRQVWETLANDALQRAGFTDVQIDRRTLEDQGIDRIPQIHIGPEGKAADKRRKEGESKDEDSEDEGEGEQGSQSSGSGDKSPAPAPLKEKGQQPTPEKDAEKENRVDYQAIDNGLTRAELVEEIKQLNTERAQWPAPFLEEQIKAIDQKMSRLDKRVHHLERIHVRTSFPFAVKKAITEVIKFSKQILFVRILNRDALRLSSQEHQSRMMRQNFRYGRPYRIGVHEQIRTMKARLHILEGMQDSYKKYKAFVVSIENAIARNPAINTETPQRKFITIQESAIKLTLKADLLREGVPERFNPAKDKSAIGKITTPFDEQNPVVKTLETNQGIIHGTTKEQTPNQPQPIPLQSREQQDWFIPANSEMQLLGQHIDYELRMRGHHVEVPDTSGSNVPGLRGAFQSALTSGKQSTYENVRNKVRKEAQIKREGMPPQYRREPHEQETPKESKISGLFNRESSSYTEPRSENLFQKNEGFMPI